MALPTANPLLELADQPAMLPPFDRIEPHHVEPAMQQVLQEARAAVTRLEQLDAAQVTQLLQGLEALHDRLGRVWGAVEHLLSVRDREALRDVHDRLQPEVVRFSLELGQNPTLYRLLGEIRKGPLWHGLSAADRRSIAQLLLDAELAGVGLQGAAQARFAAVQQELAELSTRFGHHVLDATKAWFLDITDAADVAGLPDSLLQLAARAWQQAHPDAGQRDFRQGPWRLTLDPPCIVPFLQYSERRDLRERLYRAHISRASRGETDNTPIIQRILARRQEQATLLGYDDYAALSLASKMAPSVQEVLGLLERLRTSSWQPALQDLQDLRDEANRCGAAEAADLRPWDVAFWAERLRVARYDYSDDALRPWFPLPRVLQGMFALVRQLFGIEVEAADGQAPVWHPDVRFFRVRDATGQPLAAFYLDPYSRPEEKRGGAWMNECVGRSSHLGRDGSPRLPVAYLVCNGTPPIGDQPSLMTFGEVETLLHEFGHGLQHMLTTVGNGLCAGIRGVEWDAVELPSQFMENWCYHGATMTLLSAHVETGEPLPAATLAQIRAARTFRAASDMLRQLMFGLTDLHLHHGYDPAAGRTPFDVHREIAARTAPLGVLAEDRFLCGFSHIFAGGYAAGYYSYKWAEVLSADAFAAFEEAGLDDPDAMATVGQRFRDTVLALGGSVDPMEVFARFRGRAPDVAALLRHSGLSGGDTVAAL
jgi:oligopeptidase A